MIGYVLLGILFMVLVALITRGVNDLADDLTVSIMFGVVVAFIIILTGALVASSIRPTTTLEDSYTIENIYTLKDNSFEDTEGKVSGFLFFVYGKTTTERGLVYTTMVGNDEEGYLVENFDASETYLFMDGNEKPYIRYVYSNTRIGSNFITKMFGDTGWVDRELVKTELHIPKNAVSVNYQVDLK